MSDIYEAAQKAYDILTGDHNGKDVSACVDQLAAALAAKPKKEKKD